MLFRTGVGDVLLQRRGHPQRGADLCRAAEEAFLVVGDEVVEDFLELGRVVLAVQRKARQGDERFAEQPRVQPGESGVDLLVSVPVADEEVGVPAELVIEARDRAEAVHFPFELALERMGVHLGNGGGEDDALPFLHLEFEPARDEQVFTAARRYSSE